MQFCFDPVNTRFKSITGGIPSQEKITFTVQSDADSVFAEFRRDDGVWKKAFPMKRSSGGFFVFSTSFPKGLYWYRFIADGRVFGKSKDKTAAENASEEFQLTVFERNARFSDRLKGGIIYQIFPDRFCRSGDFSVPEGKIKREDWGGLPSFRAADGKVYNNEFFGGNFKGITEKLPYLKKLNVTAVYLNPIAKAYSSHRYDTGDYLKTDSVLGDENDLKVLLARAKKMGIDFIFDGVYNHVGADSVYFDRGNVYGGGAYSDKKSKYRNWFSFKSYPDDYECWWGFKTLPAIKKDCKSFQDFIVEKVLPYWFGLGFCGVRLDVADELSPSFIKRIKKKITELKENSVLIGEVWEDATNKIAYGERREYFLGGQLDTVMNYPLKDGIVDFVLSGCEKYLCQVVKEQLNNFPRSVLDNLMNVLSTHDTSRILTVFSRDRVVTDKDIMKYESYGEEELKRGKTLCKLAFALQFTLFGVPSVYYGDEAGLFGDLDPYNRKCYPWGNEDEEMLGFTEKLSKIRSENKVFAGDFKLLYAEKKVIIFERSSDEDVVIVAVSRFETDVKIRLDGEFEDLFSGNTASLHDLPSDGFLILKKCS